VTAKSDPTLKALVEIEPECWPALLGQPTGRTQVIDADIATISGAADKVLRVAARSPYLLHLEFVAGHDVTVLPRKLLVRNSLLDDRHDLPVRSAVLLLHPAADSPQVTGLYQRGFPGEEDYIRFRYHVVRVWQLAPELLLAGGLAVLPLAPISAVTKAELPGIIQRMGQRLASPQGRKQAATIWGAAYVLLGLRYSAALAAQLLQGVMSMKESSTYQAILEEGRQEGRTEGALAEAKKVLRLQGDSAFGPPDAQTIAAIEQVDDLPHLEDLLRRVRSARSWQELFPASAPRPRFRRGTCRSCWPVVRPPGRGCDGPAGVLGGTRRPTARHCLED
jgi:predicted transposase YdaD